MYIDVSSLVPPPRLLNRQDASSHQRNPPALVGYSAFRQLSEKPLEGGNHERSADGTNDRGRLLAGAMQLAARRVPHSVR
jgi:hypothetical protein